MVSKFFENIDMDTGLVVYGIEETMKSVQSGAVESILCWEGITHNRVTLKNKETEEIVIKFIKEEEMNDPKHRVDAKGVELEIEDSINAVEWLTEHSKEFGSSL